MLFDKEKNYSNFISSAAFSNIIKSLSKPEFFSKYCDSNTQIIPSNSNQKFYSSEEDIKNISDNLSEDLKSDQKLNIAFVGFYGSMNYGLANSESDYDFFIVYYPSFGNFFNHKFIRYSVIKENYDYFITPFHEYMQHVMNGNIKFIEPLICGSIYFPDTSQSLHSVVSNLVEETKKFILLNYKKNFDSFIGLANNKRLNITKDNYTSNTLIYKDIYGYDIKEAANALRILYLAQIYLETGKIDFFVKNNTGYIEFEKIYIDIKNKIISKKDILQLIDSMIKNIKHQIDKFINNDDNDKNKKFYSMGFEAINQSNYNYDLIKIKKELEADIQKSVENICKNNL
ncbi:MAG: nucleotidyltransferase domain-containing protein [bacterium]